MTRKRFVKICMGKFGISRNDANWIARNRELFACLLEKALEEDHEIR